MIIKHYQNKLWKCHYYFNVVHCYFYFKEILQKPEKRKILNMRKYELELLKCTTNISYGHQIFTSVHPLKPIKTTCTAAMKNSLTSVYSQVPAYFQSCTWNSFIFSFFSLLFSRSIWEKLNKVIHLHLNNVNLSFESINSHQF